MAQLVERWSTNPKVVGSNPTPVEAFGLRLLTFTWRRNTTSEFILFMFLISDMAYSDTSFIIQKHPVWEMMEISTSYTQGPPIGVLLILYSVYEIKRR